MFNKSFTAASIRAKPAFGTPALGLEGLDFLGETGEGTFNDLVLFFLSGDTVESAVRRTAPSSRLISTGVDVSGGTPWFSGGGLVAPRFDDGARFTAAAFAPGAGGIAA
jgi:hypothetical protein